MICHFGLQTKNSCKETRGVSYYGPCHLQKKKNYENSNNIFHHAKIYNLPKKKKNSNPSKYYNSIITNIKFQHKPKLSSFQNFDTNYIFFRNVENFKKLFLPKIKKIL
jgi:hypothetical protein